MQKNTSSIHFEIQLDEHQVPEKIQWESSDGDKKAECKAALIALWDGNDNTSLKIDLWTKEMMVEDMKMLFQQTFFNLADTFERATNEKQMAEDMRDFAFYFGEKMGLITPEE
jgi:gliding motility-associated protein GldC